MANLEQRLANLERARAARKTRQPGECDRRGEVYWRAQLGSVPTWALEAELERRGDAPEQDHTIRLPGLVVDPTRGTLTWRGDEYMVGGRQMEVLYALALAQQQGFRCVRYAVLGPRIWRGFRLAEARQNARVYVTYLRKRFPGLIDTVSIGNEAGIGLVLDPTPGDPGADRGPGGVPGPARGGGPAPPRGAHAERVDADHATRRGAGHHRRVGVGAAVSDQRPCPACGFPIGNGGHDSTCARALARQRDELVRLLDQAIEMICGEFCHGDYHAACQPFRDDRDRLLGRAKDDAR